MYDLPTPGGTDQTEQRAGAARVRLSRELVLAHDQVVANQVGDRLGNCEIFDEVGVQDREPRTISAVRSPRQTQRARNSILRVKASVELVQAATQDIADGVRHWRCFKLGCEFGGVHGNTGTRAYPIIALRWALRSVVKLAGRRSLALTWLRCGAMLECRTNCRLVPKRWVCLDRLTSTLIFTRRRR